MAIYSQNVASAHNYGIIMAGDGGNGGRGYDGIGGKDVSGVWTSSTAPSAPGAGSKGSDGGAAGAAGEAKDGALNTVTTYKEPKPGETGKHGNNGWNGFNLIQYSGKNTNYRDISHFDTDTIGDYTVYYDNKTFQRVKAVIKVQTKPKEPLGDGINEYYWVDGKALEIHFCCSHMDSNQTIYQNKDWSVSNVSQSKLQIIYKTEGEIHATTAAYYYWGKGAGGGKTLKIWFYVHYDQEDIVQSNIYAE